MYLQICYWWPLVVEAGRDGYQHKLNTDERPTFKEDDHLEGSVATVEPHRATKTPVLV